ncbi:MAG: cobalamin B12-binding domain-containing protein [Actinomycetota bacterium]
MEDSLRAGVRIGTLCARVGITPERLRAWERRYQLVIPQRSPSGYRIYSPADEARVARMLSLIELGYAPVEAARISIHGTEVSAKPASASALVAELHMAAASFNDAAVHGVLDHLFAQESVDLAISEVVMPFLFEQGQQWESGSGSIAEEHFTTTIIRGRLGALSHRWGAGDGRMALLACAPGERHDIGLLCFGLALRARGWRVTYLGADTPISELDGLAVRLAPAATVISAAIEEVFEAHLDELASLSARTPLYIGGAGSTEAVALRIDARLLRGDPVSAAIQLTRGPSDQEPEIGPKPT